MQWSELGGTDSNPISTSRPGTINPTLAIPTQLYQIEMGTNFSIYNHISIPLLLIRMGIYNNTELQVGLEGGDVSISALYGGISIIDNLENSIMLTTSLPKMAGSSYEDNNDSLIAYSTYLPISYSFKNGFSLLGQIAGVFTFNDSLQCSNENFLTQHSCLDAGWQWNNNSYSTTEMNYSIAIGNSIDDNTSWFFEVNRKLNNEKNNPFSMLYGLIFISDNKNIQFDLSMGLNFQRKEEKWETIVEENYVELGFSFRRLE